MPGHTNRGGIGPNAVPCSGFVLFIVILYQFT